jgi:hypothetical protein
MSFEVPIALAPVCIEQLVATILFHLCVFLEVVLYFHELGSLGYLACHNVLDNR